MSRKPDQPCAVCGKLLYGGTGSLPAGERMCQDCRRKRRLTTPKWPLRLCERDGCDRRFSGPSSQRTCSLSCGQRLRLVERGPARRRTPRQCEVCGRDYFYTRFQQRTCGRACGGVLSSREYRERVPETFPFSRVWGRSCVSCGAFFVARREKSVTCGQECYREHYKTLQRQRWAARPRPPEVRRWCAGCDASFSCSAVDTQRRYCTRACGTRTVRAGKRHYRERAKRAGVPYEPINKRAVFERDKWRCGICRRKVNPNLKYPDPMSASLDHVIPFALKGGHVYANVQLAHLQCNVDKGAGSAGEQLALTG